jgi:hypothetical protein
MGQKLTAREACSIIVSAFSPLRCSATPDDHDNLIRVSVLYGDNSLSYELLRSQFADSDRLNRIIFQVRSELDELGCNLDQWLPLPQ